MSLTYNQIRIVCAARIALLGHVTPNLRAVFVNIFDEEAFDLIFYYDIEPTEDEEELANLTDTEIHSYFSEFKGDFIVKTLNFPNKITDPGTCVYRRYENESLMQNSEFPIPITENYKISNPESSRNYLDQDYTKIICVIQKALLGHITPNLRRVQISSNACQTLDVVFYFNDIPKNTDKALAKLTLNELSKDLPSYKINPVLQVIAYPNLIPFGDTVYERYEPSISE